MPDLIRILKDGYWDRTAVVRGADGGLRVRKESKETMETPGPWALAARFVSGYLDCPDTRAARGSSHAWTECYFPHLGWRGFDPTTGRICDHRHIVIGTSHHPRGVMPVSGRFFGATNAFQNLTVSVEFSTPDTCPEPSPDFVA